MKKTTLHLPAFHNPRKDWHFILGCFVLLLIAAISISFYFNGKLSASVQNVSVEHTSPTQILDREELDRVIKNLEQRALNAATIPSVVLNDPSR